MDGAVAVVLGFLALTCVFGLAGLVYDRLRHPPATPFHWSDAAHQHAVLMSRYYANYGPRE
jgi:hypothetical protein